MNNDLPQQSELDPIIDLNVNPLPPGDPRPASSVELIDLRIRRKFNAIQRLLDILRESSFTKRNEPEHPLGSTPVNYMEALNNIYQYTSAVLICTELPKLISARRYFNHIATGYPLIGDDEALEYIWSSWQRNFINYKNTWVHRDSSFGDFSHPITQLPYFDQNTSHNNHRFMMRPHIFEYLYRNHEYRVKSANFMRASAKEKEYIKTFFKNIGKIKKKVIICRFDVFMNRTSYGIIESKIWQLDLREKIRKKIERIKAEYSKLVGYIHFIPSSNCMLPVFACSLSHLVLVFDLAKDDHHILSELIATKRTIHIDDWSLEIHPTSKETGNHKAIGCGPLDLSQVSSMSVIEEMADYMTVERRVLRPLVRKPRSADWQVIKGLQLHSFL